MPTYIKAYELKQLRAFPEWTELSCTGDSSDASRSHNSDESMHIESDGEALGDHTIVYIHEDFVVTRSAFDKNEVIYDSITDNWKEYCKAALGFSVPDWKAEAERARENSADI